MTSPTLAQVLVNLDAKALDKRTFTYSIPEIFQPDVRIGVPVAVPFGRMPLVTGFVVGFAEKTGESFQVKEITELLDDTPLFSLEYLQFLDWISHRYATPLAQVLNCALPANLVEKNRKTVCLNPERQVNTLLGLANLPPLERRVLAYLQENRRAYTVKYLATQLKMPVASLHKVLAGLKQQDWIVLQNELRGTTQDKTVRHVRLTSDSVADDVLEALTRRQREMVAYLQRHPKGIALKQLLESLETTLPTVQRLEQTGLITVESRAVVRDPLAYYRQVANREGFHLSPAQAAAVEQVLESDAATPNLLFGVTGSGKTEVYLTLTERILAQGRSALMMVPEIALTSQISKRFIERFGIENIALWHSNLSDGERKDTWRRIADGSLRIVIGARSAIFAPLQNLGLIMIDEEHDDSLKQDSPAPRYHVRTLALELAQRQGAKVVFGSATPDIRSFHIAKDLGTVLVLPERVGGRDMAAVELVNMRKERAEGNGGTLSRSLKEALTATLEAQDQAIIMINRRGFHTLVSCTECEHVFKCPQCTVALTVHRMRNQVRCHYCGFEQSIPQFCPVCASMALSQTGTGTQRVEEEIQKAFPDARILRLDSDVLTKKSAYREVFDAFSGGEADILVGTQMIAKGLDIPQVTLVGVINADSSFYLPDYRSSERGFQLLTQVVGRAGRGEKPGRAIIQSLDPDNPIIQFACQQDYLGFYRHEVENRLKLDFPPFSQLFRFIVSCPDEFKARHFIRAAVANLQSLLEQQGLTERLLVLGPAPCVISRIQGKYRFHCLVKNLAGETGHALLTRFYQAATPPEDIHFILDIDAQSLL